MLHTEAEVGMREAGGKQQKGNKCVSVKLHFGANSDKPFVRSS